MPSFASQRSTSARACKAPAHHLGRLRPAAIQTIPNADSQAANIPAEAYRSRPSFHNGALAQRRRFAPAAIRSRMRPLRVTTHPPTGVPRPCARRASSGAVLWKERVRRMVENDNNNTHNHRLHRRLTAIMFAEYAGYSRLAAEDDTRAVAALEAYRGILAPIIEEHGGRVLEFAGDIVFATFESGNEAVEAGIAIQRALAEHNDDSDRDSLA